MAGFLEGFSFIFRGGLMMLPLLASSLIALTVIIERWKAFDRLYQTPSGFVPKVLAAIQEGKLSEASHLCYVKSFPVASVLKTGIEHFKNSTEEMEIAMKNEGESWVPVLEKRIHWLDTIITIA